MNKTTSALPSRAFCSSGPSFAFLFRFQQPGWRPAGPHPAVLQIGASEPAAEAGQLSVWCGWAALGHIWSGSQQGVCSGLPDPQVSKNLYEILQESFSLVMSSFPVGWETCSDPCFLPHPRPHLHPVFVGPLWAGRHLVSHSCLVLALWLLLIWLGLLMHVLPWGWIRRQSLLPCMEWVLCWVPSQRCRLAHVMRPQPCESAQFWALLQGSGAHTTSSCVWAVGGWYLLGKSVGRLLTHKHSLPARGEQRSPKLGQDPQQGSGGQQMDGGGCYISSEVQRGGGKKGGCAGGGLRAAML